MREFAAGKSAAFNGSCGGVWEVERYCGSYVQYFTLKHPNFTRKTH